MGDERDVRLTFDAVAELYARARPTYPDVLVDRLFDMLPEQPQIVEMGPGTGQATELLLAKGATVTAVELGPQLAGALRDKFGTVDACSVVNASFEEAPLPRNSFDAVVAATAYHWVEASAQVVRPLELLRPGGVLAVVDLIHVDSPADHGYFAAVQPIYERHGLGHQAMNGEPRTPVTYETAMPATVEPLRSSGRYRTVEVHRHRWDQTYSAAHYRELLMTYSGIQMKPEPERSIMVDALIEVVDRDFAGSITRPLCATLTLAVAAI